MDQVSKGGHAPEFLFFALKSRMDLLHKRQSLRDHCLERQWKSSPYRGRFLAHLRKERIRLSVRPNHV